MIETVNNQTSLIQALVGAAETEDSSTTEDSKEFQKELSQIGGSMASITTLSPESKEQAAAQTESVSKMMSTRTPSADNGVRTALAERLPSTVTSTASLTTGSAIAGQRPWSRDWVFQPGDEKNAELKPLLDSQGESSGQALAALSPELLAKIKSWGDSQAVSSKTIAQSEKIEQSNQTAQSDTAAQAVQMAQNGEQSMDLGSLVVNSEGVSITEPKLSGKRLSTDDYLATRAQARPVGLENSMDPSLQVAPQAASQTGMSAKGVKAVKTNVVAGGVSSLDTTTSGPTLKRGQLEPSASFEGELLRQAPANLAVTAQALPSSQSGVPAMAVMSGNVVQGAMTRERLSTDSLVNLSSEISKLKHSGGEIRMRLRPDNLGELRIQISTVGSDVGLKIQASDERVKKVLEESIGSLKESLSAQSLTLGKLDLTVGQALENRLGGSMGEPKQDLLQNGQQQSFLGQGNGRESGADRSDPALAGMRRAPSFIGGALSPESSRPAVAGSGRLDVRI